LPGDQLIKAQFDSQLKLAALIIRDDSDGELVETIGRSAGDYKYSKRTIIRY
jgi:hypothetical protein